MRDRTFNKYVNEAIALKREIDALKAKYDACKGKITEEMTERGISEYENSNAKVQYIHFPRHSFDKKSFEEAYPNLVRQYTKVQEQARFTIV